MIKGYSSTKQQGSIPILQIIYSLLLKILLICDTMEVNARVVFCFELSLKRVLANLTQIKLRKGLDTKRYQELLSRIEQGNTHVVTGGITLPNKASIALHEKLGLEKVAQFKEVGYKLEKWIDVGYWELLINK